MISIIDIINLICIIVIFRQVRHTGKYITRLYELAEDEHGDPTRGPIDRALDWEAERFANKATTP